jgi:hypothetical protein
VALFQEQPEGLVPIFRLAALSVVHIVSLYLSPSALPVKKLTPAEMIHMV